MKDHLSKILEALKNLNTQVEAIETKVTDIENRLPDETGMAHLRVMSRTIETRIAALESKANKQATKQDVKEEAQQVEKRYDEKLQGVEQRLGQKVTDEVRSAEQRLYERLKIDLTEVIEDKIEKPFYQYRNKIMDKIDALAKRLLKQDQEDVVHQDQHAQLSDIPERVGKLEEIHPQGHHPR